MQQYRAFFTGSLKSFVCVGVQIKLAPQIFVFIGGNQLSLNHNTQKWLLGAGKKTPSISGIEMIYLTR